MDLREAARCFLDATGLSKESVDEKLVLLMDRPDKLEVNNRELLVSETEFLYRLRDELDFTIL